MSEKRTVLTIENTVGIGCCVRFLDGDGQPVLGSTIRAVVETGEIVRARKDGNGQYIVNALRDDIEWETVYVKPPLRPLLVNADTLAMFQRVHGPIGEVVS